MQFREHRLDNGLEIIAECNPAARSLSMGYFVNAGSRDETPELAGVSHFLEHMVFKGTPRRSAADVNRELDELGAISNAYTSEEHTVYYATVLPEFQRDILDLLSDIMRPSLRQDDFETEKLVILEEILKYEDQPPFGAHEKCMSLFFQDHPLGNSVLGTSDSVSGLTSDAMRDYFRLRYSPGNITLVAAGNVDFPALVAQAESRCGEWEAVATDRPTPPAVQRRGFEAHVKESATQQYVVQVSEGPSATSDDRAANRILTTIFGDDTGSRLFWDLVDTGRCEYAGVGPYEFQGTGIVMSYLCCAPDDAQENFERLVSAQRQMEDGGVSDEELELAKSKICSTLVRQSERPSSRMFSVGSGWLQRREHTTVAERLKMFQAVDQAAIRRVLERYPLSIAATVTVGPNGNIKAV